MKHIDRFFFGLLTLYMLGVVVLLCTGLFASINYLLCHPKDLEILAGIVGCYFLGWAFMKVTGTKQSP